MKVKIIKNCGGEVNGKIESLIEGQEVDVTASVATMMIQEGAGINMKSEKTKSKFQNSENLKSEFWLTRIWVDQKNGSFRKGIRTSGGTTARFN